MSVVTRHLVLEHQMLHGGEAVLERVAGGPGLVFGYDGPLDRTPLRREASIWAGEQAAGMAVVRHGGGRRMACLGVSSYGNAAAPPGPRPDPTPQRGRGSRWGLAAIWGVHPRQHHHGRRARKGSRFLLTPLPPVRRRRRRPAPNARDRADAGPDRARAGRRPGGPGFPAPEQGRSRSCRRW